MQETRVDQIMESMPRRGPNEPPLSLKKTITAIANAFHHTEMPSMAGLSPASIKRTKNAMEINGPISYEIPNRTPVLEKRSTGVNGCLSWNAALVVFKEALEDGMIDKKKDWFPIDVRNVASTYLIELFGGFLLDSMVMKKDTVTGMLLASTERARWLNIGWAYGTPIWPFIRSVIGHATYVQLFWNAFITESDMLMDFIVDEEDENTRCEMKSECWNQPWWEGMAKEVVNARLSHEIIEEAPEYIGQWKGILHELVDRTNELLNLNELLDEAIREREHFEYNNTHFDDAYNIILWGVNDHHLCAHIDERVQSVSDNDPVYAEERRLRITKEGIVTESNFLEQKEVFRETIENMITWLEKNMSHSQ